MRDIAIIIAWIIVIWAGAFLMFWMANGMFGVRT